MSVFWSALLLLCFAVGCDGSTCDDLQDRSFESVELLPCGATTCRWGLDFRNGRFSWKHDTVVDSGSFACDGNAISATRDQDGAALGGSYDEATDTLTWDGRTYQPPP